MSAEDIEGPPLTTVQQLYNERAREMAQKIDQGDFDGAARLREETAREFLIRYGAKPWPRLALGAQRRRREMTDLHEEAERLANIVQRVDAPFAHKAKVADTLRDLSVRLAEVECERDEWQRECVRFAEERDDARALAAARTEAAAIECEGEALVSNVSYSCGHRCATAIRALARPEETDALAERDARIRAEERERVLDEVSEQWDLAIYGMTENGVRSLNEKAASELHPDIIAFGEWLSAIREGKT